jgi:hypothetical protein
MKLVAIVNVKHGQRRDPKTQATTVLAAAPGEEFETDGDTAEMLIANGSAATPEDYERAKLAAQPAGERLAAVERENSDLKARIAELEAELAKAKK